MSADDAFELFCADVILNSFNPSIEDIQDRIVDGTQDGGVDSVFIYVNRVLISEDTDLTGFRAPVDIELIVVQSKNEATFKEGPVNKLAASLPNLIRDIDDPSVGQGTLNASVVAAFALFSKVLKTLAPEFPTFKMSIWYASKGVNVPATAQAKADSLVATLESFFPGEVTFRFVGAQELYALAGQQKIVKAELQVAGTPLAGVNNSYIVLAMLKHYGKFISLEDGNLRSTFFEANVRDYEGSVEVNKDIGRSLKSPLPGVDFWWLNNGVTILAQQASYMDGKMHIQNPLIVNGLQTSFEVHRHVCKDKVPDERLVMIRVIQTTDEDVINRIIKATNYQTKIRPYSLRATEQIQRQIELFLVNHDIYYDRRKNYYKNIGKPAGRTVGIDRMAQAVVSLLLERPHVARARPTSLMKDPEYDQIFPSGDQRFDLRLYRVAAEAVFAASSFIAGTTSDRIYKNNLRFHLVMALGWWLCGSQVPAAQQVAAADLSKIPSAPLGAMFAWIIQEFDAIGATDANAKDGKFTDQLKAGWAAKAF